MDGEKSRSINTTNDSWSTYLKNNVDALARSGATSTAAVFNRAVSRLFAIENKTPKATDGASKETSILDRRLISLSDISITPNSYSSLSSEEGEGFHETGFSEKEINNATEDTSQDTMNSVIHLARESRDYYRQHTCYPDDTTKLMKSLQALQNVVENLSPEQTMNTLQTAWIKDELVGFHTKDVLAEMSARKQDLAFLREFCIAKIENNKKKGVVEKMASTFVASNEIDEQLLETIEKITKDCDIFALDYIKKAASAIVIQHSISPDSKDILNLDNEGFSQLITRYDGYYEKIEKSFKRDSDRNGPTIKVIENNKDIFDYNADRIKTNEVIARDFPELLEKGQEDLLSEKKKEINFQSRCRVLNKVAKHFFPEDEKKQIHLNGFLQQLSTQTSYSPHIFLACNIYYHHLGADFCNSYDQDGCERVTSISINPDNTLTAKIDYGPVTTHIVDFKNDIILPKYNNGKFTVPGNNYSASLEIAVDIEDPNNTKVTNVNISILPPQQPKQNA